MIQEINRNTNLTFELYKTLFNLSNPSSATPLHVYEPVIYFEWLKSNEFFRLGTNMAMPPKFRAIAVKESGLIEYNANSPIELNKSLQTSDWEGICNFLMDWGSLDEESKIMLIKILFALSYYEDSMKWLSNIPTMQEISSSDNKAYLAYQFHFAKFITSRSINTIPKGFIDIVNNASTGSMARVQSLFTIIYINIHYLKKYDDIETLLSELNEGIEAAISTLDSRDTIRLKIRYYSLLSDYYLISNKKFSRDIFSKSKKLINNLPDDNWIDDILKKEALRRLYDQSSMILRKSQDLSEASIFAEKSLEIDPNDSKAHWLLADLYYMQSKFKEAGKLYRRAARLGPIGTARSWFMAGVCHEILGEYEEAIDCHLTAHRLDSSSLSSLEKVNQLSVKLELPFINKWSNNLLHI